MDEKRVLWESLHESRKSADKIEEGIDALLSIREVAENKAAKYILWEMLHDVMSLRDGSLDAIDEIANRPEVVNAIKRTMGDTNRGKVLDVIGTGTSLTLAEISSLSGLSPKQVASSVQLLCRQGEVKRVKRGVYSLKGA